MSTSGGIYLNCCACKIFITQHNSDMTRHKQSEHGHPRRNQPGVKIEHLKNFYTPEEAAMMKGKYRELKAALRDS